MLKQVIPFVFVLVHACAHSRCQDGDRLSALRQYALLAENLVPGLADGSPVPLPDLEPAALEARERWRVIMLEGLETQDQRIRGVAKEAAAANRQFLGLASRASDAAAIAGLAWAVVADRPLASRRDTVKESVDDKIYAAVVQSRRAVTFLLPEIARGLAGHSHGSAVLEIDFDENWYGTEPDRINLTNVSGINLTNSTVQVDIRGRTGPWVRNVHFVASWPSGKKLWADYHTSDQSGISAISRTTATEVQEIRVSLWSVEICKEDESIIYPGKDRDADRVRQIDRLVTFSIDYVESPIFESGPCVGVTLGGVTRLPSCKVEVTCRGGNRVDQVLEYKVADSRQGDRISLQSRGSLRRCPDSFDVTVRLTDSDATVVKKGLVARHRR